MSTQSKTSELDSEQLRGLLDSISSQLNVPFLERRGRSNSHKQTLLEELQDAVNELCEKERELAAAVGIARMLLDHNDGLSKDLARHKEKENFLLSEIRLLKSELKSYSEIIVKEGKKYEKVSETLAVTETELLKAVVDQERRSLDAKSNEVEYLNASLYEDEIVEIKEYYEQELSKMKSKGYIESSMELEKNLRKINEEKVKTDNELAQLKEQYSKICNKHKHVHDKVKEIEKINKILLDAKEKTEKKHKQLNLNYIKLVEKNEKLEEELKVSELTQKTKGSTNESLLQESSSLLLELQCNDSLNEGLKLSTEESEEDFFMVYPERRFSYTPNSKNIFKYSPCLGIVFYSNINIPTKIKEIRKDPSEEYFILATQAVKLNSPHMDTICMIPHSVLYEKAITGQIPFHKWHSWIESQLNAEYIQTLYKRKGKKMEQFKRLLRRL